MFQVSGNSPTYAKCICSPPQSAVKMEKSGCDFRFKLSCSVSLHTGNVVSHRSEQIPFWKLGHITHNALRKQLKVDIHTKKKKKRGLHSELCWLFFPPCTIHFQQGATKKSVHATNPGRENTITDRNVWLKTHKKNKMVVWDWSGGFIPSSEPKKGETVFQLQLNCSYLHHNVKGVLVEKEHKKQTEKLLSVS